MRWFRRLTGSTYDREPIAEALGGAATVSEAAAEGGWLARAYRATAGFAKKHYKTALGAAVGLGAMVAAERGADASPIPWDYTTPIASDWSNLSQVVNTPSDNPSTNLNWSKGGVKFVSGIDVPSGNKLYFFDKTDRQVIGEFIITDDLAPGWYDLSQGGYGFFGDDIMNGKEGALTGNEIGVFLITPSNNRMDAYFTDGGVHFSGDSPDLGINNVTVVPEPASIALLGLGAGILALTRRRRKFQPEMDSDFGKPVMS